jgi:hypothetical protein
VGAWRVDAVDRVADEPEMGVSSDANDRDRHLAPPSVVEMTTGIGTARGVLSPAATQIDADGHDSSHRVSAAGRGCAIHDAPASVVRHSVVRWATTVKPGTGRPVESGSAAEARASHAVAVGHAKERRTPAEAGTTSVLHDRWAVVRRASTGDNVEERPPARHSPADGHTSGVVRSSPFGSRSGADQVAPRLLEE